MPALEQSNEVIQGVPLLEVVHCTLKVHATFQHIWPILQPEQSNEVIEAVLGD